MRTVFVALFCLGLILTGCQAPYFQMEYPPRLTSVTIIDRNGFTETISNKERLEQYEKVDFLANQPYQKVMRLYQRDSLGNIRAYITSYHSSGHPKQYLEVINHRACGIYREWHPNGQMKIEGKVLNGEADLDFDSERTWLFDQLCRVWNEEGKLIAEIYYCNGQLEGTSIYYHDNGSIWKRIPCHEGNVEGTLEIYTSDNLRLQTIQYAAGIKQGSSLRYWNQTQLAAEEIYDKGLLTTAKYYDIQGKLISSIQEGQGYRAIFGKETVCELQEYQRGILEGTVKLFGDKAVLAREYQIKNGIKDGTEIAYYNPAEVQNNLQPQISIQWSEGLISGLVRTWYPNGIQESQREMSGNEKNGLLTAWYPEGSIMLIENYEHDKLIEGQYFIKGEKEPISEVHGGRGVATLFDAKGNLIKKVQYLNSKPTD